MTREHMEELAALAALDALDGDDLAAWQRLASENPEAARLANELSQVTAQLAMAPPTPAPSALRGRVMGAVFGHAPAPDESRERRWAAWAAAAAVALLALVGTTATVSQRESVVVRDTRPDTRHLFVPLTGYGEFADATACVLWDSGQRGWFVQAAGLPDLPTSHRYRVWAVDSDGSIFDCGELPQTRSGAAWRFVRPVGDIESMKGFAISIEPEGTSPSGLSTPAVLISPEVRG